MFGVGAGYSAIQYQSVCWLQVKSTFPPEFLNRIDEVPPPKPWILNPKP